MNQLGSMPSFRHYAKWNQEEVVILGYNNKMNDCIIVRVTALPVDDQVHLRQIASSAYAQSQDFLMPILQSQMHASKYDWLRYLLTRMARNDKTVVKVPLKDLYEMNPDQKAFFGGWGKSSSKPEATKAPLGSPEHNEQARQAQIVADEEQALVDLPGSVQEQGNSGAPAAQPDGMAQIAQALGALAESQAAMASSLEKLTAKVKPPRAVRKTVKKRVTRRAPAKPKAVATVGEPVLSDAAPAPEPAEA